MSESPEINVVAIHYPKPDKIQEFRALVLRVKNTFANHPGKVHHHAFETQTGEEIVVVERSAYSITHEHPHSRAFSNKHATITSRFKDQASLDQILATEEFKEISALVPGLVRQPPVLTNGNPLPGFEASGNKKGVAAFLAESHWV
ncbi:hypothetical protein BJY00DRAFT_310150 [Aspergillus carlsbadensis]|nr:hypothetical protein BJY00DRAFT_310150 [Aspergillus carlsbadensis]